MGICYQIGDKDTRPWGTWEVLAIGENYIVKRINIYPKQSVSLQLHHYRNEHWIIVKGTGTVILNDTTQTVLQNESVYIPVETKHRIANDTDDTLIFIEVQTGDTLDENDIERFDDQYGRVQS